MKVLVFGKTGQVATELQKFPGVTALGRDQADLRDPKACALLISETDADAVINAAAYTAVDRAEEEPALAMLVNGTAPTQMAQAAAQRGIPFLHISTDYVFDGSGNEALATDAATTPINMYGRSKLEGENGVRAACGAHVILRTSWVFSAHGTNFVKTMLRLSETHRTLNLVADQIGGPTSAADIAATLVIMARHMISTQHMGGTYHYCGAPAVSWADFAREIFKQAQRDVRVHDIKTTEYPTAAQRPLNSRLDCSTLSDDFGIVQPDWKASLALILRNL
ncbi:dTDP-4-dehydrorhamnose reductase [Shimia sediminis]|uniref:dTDP-4-dehydrorhamnose reductase n=1 Tax=Shimia sediminis TaxID=2497945 RepID=UPI000F8CFA68|nr:dTDP-4-dehydrorhamnose reductase [Shimia sediminis]